MVRPKSQEPSLKQSTPVELHKDIAYRMSHLMERYNDRLTLNNLRLSERYINEEIHFLLRFRFGDGQEYIASFQREPLDLGRNESTLQSGNCSELSSHVRVPTWQDAVAAQVRVDSEQQFMLVNNVEVVDVPEQFTLTSRVWFDSVNRVSCVLAEFLYSSSAVGFIFLGALADGKVEIVEGAGRASGDAHQMVGQMLKTAPEVMNGIPDYGRNLRGNLPNVTEIIAALSGVRVVLGSDVIRASTPSEERHPCSLQILDVLVGPF